MMPIVAIRVLLSEQQRSFGGAYLSHAGTLGQEEDPHVGTHDDPVLLRGGQSADDDGETPTVIELPTAVTPPWSSLTVKATGNTPSLA